MTPVPPGGILWCMDPSDQSQLSKTANRCGLYVHVPFCETKCGYCDFYSVAAKDRATAPLVDQLTHELDLRLATPPHPVRTVFCGGGTPTVLPPDELGSLLFAIARNVTVEQLEEFTVEANPATVDDAGARLLRDAGVTRVSMGAQSFFAEELATLERLHAPEDIAGSVEILRRSGIGQINLDLIFGVPGQTLDTWRLSLQRAIELEPDHVACYGLTYEPDTRLTAMRDHGRMTPCDENLEADMFLMTIDVLEQSGYRQYETSNYAKPGCESAHNLIYWRNAPYVGVGPSAAGCYHRRRYKNVADVNGYVRRMEETGSAEAQMEIITPEMLMHEMILMQLRLIEGLSVTDYSQRVGVDPLEQFAGVIKRLSSMGLVAASDTHIALTREGRLVSDAVMTEFAIVCGGDVPLKVVAG